MFVLLAAIATGCGLTRQGTVVNTCTHESECDDGNPCTLDRCAENGQCASEPSDVALEQIAGDCQQILCADGLATVEAAPLDVPEPEPCVSYTCVDATLVTAKQTNDEACVKGLAVGTCDGDGVCAVTCDGSAPAECDDLEVCTADACDLALGQCVNIPLHLEVPLELQLMEPVGDCRLAICIDGAQADEPDNTDLPIDLIDCTADLCNDGVPDNPGLTGTPCETSDEAAHLCDDEGACVHCLTDGLANDGEDCITLPATTFCHDPDCVDNLTCQSIFTPDLTAMPFEDQIAGNCQLHVCDGLGGDKQIPDDAADPTPLECRQCDGSGNIVTVAGAAPDGAQDADSCDDDSKSTGCPFFPCTCDATGNCLGKQGSQCNGDADCITGQCADGVCCDANCGGECRRCNEPGMVGTCVDVVSDTDGDTCDSNSASTGCDGVPCTCNAAGDCVGEQASPCSDDTECITNQCADGRCCNVDCLGECERCNAGGMLGTCVDVTSTTDNNSCDGNDKSGVCPFTPCTCDAGGNCLGQQGSVCNADAECITGQCADGRCCNADCQGECQRCSAAGVCGSVTNGTDDTCDADTTSAGCPFFPCSCDAGGNCEGVNGSQCNVDGDCVSGFCTDGVCCNVDCAGTCESCLALHTGGTDGVCAAVTIGTDPAMECTATASACIGNNCSGTAGFCEAASSATVCRAGSGDVCDPDELCTGTTGAACPADSFKMASFVCNAGSGDTCDPDELCPGMALGTCPADTFKMAGFVCNAGSGDTCDPDEVCSGMANMACPSDTFKMAGFVCDPGSGDLCDPDEVCSGMADVACPADTFETAAFVCRASAGNPNGGAVCDPAENCPGTAGNPCPADVFSMATVECRAGFGSPNGGTECDPAESCPGTAGGVCPADSFSSSTCRTGSGAPNGGAVCDPDEVCPGMAGGVCPTDTFSAGTVECRASAGNPNGGAVCDQAEDCPGTAGDPCPVDGFSMSSVVCRAGGGNPNGGAVCDPDENCPGTTGGVCPTDSFSPAATVCRADAGACDVGAENCPGMAGGACAADTFENAATECGGALLEPTCDPDHCSGTDNTCVDEAPAAQFTACAEIPSGECNTTGVCSVANGDTCTDDSDCASEECPVDDFVCCDVMCDGECESCDSALTVGGMVGVCDDIIVGTDPDAECAGGCCAAMATCGTANCSDGELCPGGNGDCTGNICADGTCCNNACDMTCESCNQTGVEGVCTALMGAPDPNECDMNTMAGMCDTLPCTCNMAANCVND